LTLTFYTDLQMIQRAVIVVTAWYMDLQLPVQSVPITTNVESSNPAHGMVFSIQHYVLKFVMQVHLSQLVGRYMVFNATFNNISVIS
jgi:hypothetical protein